MELHQIRYFLAVAEILNFTRAAEQCGVSQPSLTRAIKRLEDELGAPLVRRERNNTHLTELGRRVKPRLEQALSLTEIARSEADNFSRMSNGSLALGVMCTVGPNRMISLVDHLSKEYPQLTLKLQTGSGQEIVNCLITGEIDVAIVGMAQYPDEIDVLDLYRERYMVAFPAKHRFMNMDIIALKELQGERYLERLNCEYMEFFYSALEDYEPGSVQMHQKSIDAIDVRHESEHEDWIQAMIIAGMGCAVIPEHMSLNAELQMRPLIEPEVWRSIGIATARGRPNTPVVSMFRELCLQMNWGNETRTVGR